MKSTKRFRTRKKHELSKLPMKLTVYNIMKTHKSITNLSNHKERERERERGAGG